MTTRQPIKKSPNGFAALLSTMIVMAIIIIVVAGLSLVTVIEQKITRNISHSAQAYYAAESGVEDSLYRLIKSQSYSATNNFSVGSSSVAITISDTSSQKIILAEGQDNNRFRKLQIKLNTGEQGAAFYYGVQVGEGGLTMDNNSRVQGSIYSNGSIRGSQGATITGDAWVANKALLPNQQSVSNDTDFAFGQASPIIDPAQSFISSLSGNLIKISLLLKKVNSPTGKTVRVITDNGGQPSKNLAGSGSYGSLSASQVSEATYSWVDVTLNSPTPLSAGTKYWIVIDSSLDESNYFIWGKDSTNDYGGGAGQYSLNWNATTPVWASAGGDLGFKVWLGQENNYLNSLTVGANAHANTISQSHVDGDAYYQTISDTIVEGTRHPDSPDPAQNNLPLSQAVIDGWKAQAADGGVLVGDYVVDGGAVQELGPQKIIGNLIVSNGGDLTVTGTLFVTGSISVFNNAKIRLGTNFGAYSGVIVTDGLVTVANGCVFYGNSDNSYVLILSTKSGDAINLANNSETALFYASDGAINVSNNAILKELTAYQIHLNNGAQVIYESGLASVLFSSGVGGSWQVLDWAEAP